MRLKTMYISIKEMCTNHYLCSLPRRILQSLGFTVNRVLMKLFKSSDIAIIEQCIYFFNVELPSVQL